MVPKYCVLQQGRIVLTAHSNAAGRALLEKAASHMPSMLGIDPETILFVETKEGRIRRLRSGHVLSEELEAYSLESRKRKMVEAQPLKWARLAEFAEEPDDVRFRASWRAQQRDLVDEIRQNTAVFICTLSTAGSSFFMPNGNELKQRFLVDMVIVDESSQCMWPNVFELWVTVNPPRLILGGDDKQLEPFVMSKSEKSDVWRVSPLEEKRKSVARAFTLLDVAFRMPQNLYGPVSDDIYKKKVKAQSSCEGRAVGPLFIVEPDFVIKLTSGTDGIGLGVWDPARQEAQAALDIALPHLHALRENVQGSFGFKGTKYRLLLDSMTFNAAEITKAGETAAIINMPFAKFCPVRADYPATPERAPIKAKLVEKNKRSPQQTSDIRRPENLVEVYPATA